MRSEGWELHVSGFFPQSLRLDVSISKVLSRNELSFILVFRAAGSAEDCVSERKPELGSSWHLCGKSKKKSSDNAIRAGPGVPYRCQPEASRVYPQSAGHLDSSQEKQRRTPEAKAICGHEDLCRPSDPESVTVPWLSCPLLELTMYKAQRAFCRRELAVGSSPF